MRLTNKISGHLQAQVAFGVTAKSVYTWPQQANVVVGEVLMGDIWSILLTPASWKLDVSTNTAKEVAKLYVYFLTPQPDLDFNAAGNELLINRCTAVAIDLLARLRADTSIRIRKEEVSSMFMYDVNNRNLTGVRLTLDLEENQGQCIALEERTIPEVTLGTSDSVTANSFAVKGNAVTYDPQTQVLNSVGLLWGTTPDALTNQILAVSTADTFDVYLQGLEEQTPYYYRAFAVVDEHTYLSPLGTTSTMAAAGAVLLLYASEPSEITMKSAYLNGVIAMRDVEVDAYGVVWADHTEPTLDDNVEEVELDEDEFSYLLEGLDPDTVYFYRAYATVAGETTYSAEESFSTAQPRPVVETFDGTNILSTKFTANGLVYDNNYDVDEGGFVYGKTPDPTIEDDTKVIPTFTNFNYNHILDNLDAGEIYHYRSFAKCGDIYVYGGDKAVQLEALPYNILEYAIFGVGAYLHIFYTPKSGYSGEIEYFRKTIKASSLNGFNLGNLVNQNTDTLMIRERELRTIFRIQPGGVNSDTAIFPQDTNSHKVSFSFEKEYYLYVDGVQFISGTKTTYADRPSHPNFINKLYSNTEITNIPTEWGKMTFSTAGEVFMILQPCELIADITSEQSWDSQPHYAGECGFWDTVGDKFYGNAGTGSITKP